jgi:hypothetical protein
MPIGWVRARSCVRLPRELDEDLELDRRQVDRRAGDGDLVPMAIDVDHPDREDRRRFASGTGAGTRHN